MIMGADNLLASEAKSLAMNDDIIYFQESGIEMEYVPRDNRYPNDDQNSVDKDFNCRNGAEEPSRCLKYEHESGDNVLNCRNTENGIVDGAGMHHNGDIDTGEDNCNCAGNDSTMLPLCGHTNSRQQRYNSLRNIENYAHFDSSINTNYYKFQNKCEKCEHLSNERNGLLHTATLNAVGSVDGRGVTSKRYKRPFGLENLPFVLFLNFLLFQSIL